MVAQFPLTALQKLLIEGLELIPQDWALTPLRGNKAPYRSAWQHEPPLTRTQIIPEIESGLAQGYGIRTGTVSDGIVAIDFDGASAMQKALELSGWEPLPDTVSFTSNRTGREQRLYLIPKEFWGAVKTTKIKTGVIGDDGKPEQLELRWDGCQSVLPPSVHPMTGHYRWRKSPQEVAIAPAPMWVIEAMLVEPEPTHHKPERLPTAYTRKARTGEEWSDEEWALSYLSALSPYRCDDYDDWVAVGMALHSVNDSLLTEWDNWSRRSSKYTPGDCEKKWKSFKRSGVAIGTLGRMAKEDGWRSPFDKNTPYSGFNTPRKPTSRESSEPKPDIVERFKSDLLTLANTDDPIVQLLKINELAATYRIPAGEIRRAIAKVETATRTPKAQFFALDDFLSMETEGIDYLIPGLLPRGETVLCAGLPKSGKTLLAIDAGFAIATGESQFLGEQVIQGRVLLVSVDESAQSTKAKLLKRGFRPTDAANLAVMTSWDISQLSELEAKLEDFRPDLVIIDSLKRITAGREISENSAEFADIIYQLKELTGRYNAASILIHHANKSSDAVGVSKVRGSTAITGACWGVWQLDHIIQTTDENGKPIKGKPKFDPSDPRRTFTAICRDTENQEITIQFNPENHSYAIASQDEETQSERKTQEQQIIELLSQYHPNGLTGREIKDFLGLGNSTYTVLNRMVNRKTVTHRQSKVDRRSMVYCLPKTRDTHPPLVSVDLLDKFSETPMVEIKTNIQHLSNKLDNLSNNQQGTTPQNGGVSDDVVELKPALDNAQRENIQQVSTTGGGVCLHDEMLDEYEGTQTVTQLEEAIAKITPEQAASTSADEAIARRVGSEAQIAPSTESVNPSFQDDEEVWSPGDRVRVDTDVPSLRGFNDRIGTVEVVKDVCAQCLINFGSEVMYIPFRGLRRIE
jgi:hypothetical protein